MQGEKVQRWIGESGFSGDGAEAVWECVRCLSACQGAGRSRKIAVARGGVSDGMEVGVMGELGAGAARGREGSEDAATRKPSS